MWIAGELAAVMGGDCASHKCKGPAKVRPALLLEFFPFTGVLRSSIPGLLRHSSLSFGYHVRRTAAVVSLCGVFVNTGYV